MSLNGLTVPESKPAMRSDDLTMPSKTYLDFEE